MAAILMTSGVVAAGPPAHADDGCNAAANPIVCENALAGADPSVWDVDGSGDDTIQGFSTDISVNIGGTIGFKINTNAPAYTIQIFRTGYYQGLGARKIADVTPSVSLPQTQPACYWDPTVELTDCGNWALSASWSVPPSAVSGVYIALLTRTDTGGKSQITFVVRNDASHSDVLYQTSDPTWEAYNTYGGSDFYQGAANGRAYKVSYNRPFATRGNNAGRDFYFGAEYPEVRFLEKNGYNMSYFSGVDTDRYGSQLLNHKVFLSVGHDEYWSTGQRANVQAAINAGVNAQFLSGNEMYWHTRYEPSVAGAATNYRTLVTYKETWANAKIDPSTTWTGTWRDPRFASTANGAGLPENGVTGTMYMSNFSDLPITVTAAQGKTRLWRNTSLTSLAAGSTSALAQHTVGYESDEDLDNGFRPAGLVDLSTTTGAVPQYLQDFGNTVAPGTTTHHVTLHRAPSGALVFSAGTIQWSWGLDAEHDGTGAAADPRMQQAQINLMADMGAQPGSLQSGLTASTKSTDTTPPTVTVTSPAAGASIANGASVTVTGTASDVGGVVAGVEVSTDGGTSWHPASGTNSWTYSYVQNGLGTQTIQVRATDDSGNYPSSPTAVPLTVTGPASILGSQVPAVADSGDASAVEVGLQFTAQQNGFISGVRFYKSSTNTGTHTGSLWDTSGNRLATVTFSGESASGWQTASFTSAVAVTAGTKYVVSYSAPAGHYSATSWAFAYRGLSDNVYSVAGGFGAPAAGVYSSALGTYPQSSYNNANYWVDAVFTTVDNSPLTASSQWPLPGSSSVPLSTTIGAVMSKAVDPASIASTVKDANGVTVAGTVTYTASTRTATFTPTSALNGFVNYTVTMTAKDLYGKTLSSGGAWSFTTVKPDPAPGVCPCSLFTDSTVPSILEVKDLPVTLGVKFYSTVAGAVTGVRFYKSVNNTGTHVGTLWTSSGQQLATGTFTGESTAGWETLTFSTPVNIAANTDYLVSYRSPTGFYSATPGDFSGSGITRAPLVAGNAVAAYSYSDGFPSSASTTNYMVDVVFATPASPLTVVSESPASGAVNVDPATKVSITVSGPVASGYALSVSAGGSAVAGAVSQSSDGSTITFTPAAALPAGATMTATLSGARSAGGATLATQSWSFTVKAAAPASLTLGDFNSDGHADVLARDGSGALFLYRGNGAAGWLNPAGVQVGSGWNIMTAIVSPGDFDGDGHNDVLARDAAGALWLYPGNGAGGWGTPRQVGSGWNIMTRIVAAHDFTGDSYPDIVAVDASGALWLYPGNGHGGWLAPQAIGSGWNGMTSIVGIRDFAGDGNPGLLARDPYGRLWFYAHSASGWKPPVVVGSGWNIMTAIVSVGDFTGDGHDDILGRTSSGALVVYPASGLSGWGPPAQVGSGWNIMTWIG
ncbi:N,N-dimethylformamidase beta subunit family domain-containing protein [Leifsonia sp. AG29]|uniref:N,N-dimethylformamidase beta subunit family domain-containing protein n=1 Tax=Leifsonia sp. AG29 TaxID=2598860 RepID=UPI00131A7B32|nr:N,N-dimethylformamidase beta subunit family domain-containing protein [Leifsonia sp. AG29]